MPDLEKFKEIEGSWNGEYNLWLDPNAPPTNSKSKMKVRTLPSGTFIQMEYSWEDSGKQQFGTLIIGYEVERKRVVASWIDSWHLPYDIMLCEGFINEEEQFKFTGSYRAPEGPNWEWRTEIKIHSRDRFDFLMYNIHPNTTEAIAVKVEYSRDA